MNAQLSRAQFNHDNAQPRDDSRREAAIEARTEQLIAEMWQDNEHLSDAVNDASITIGWYRRDLATLPAAVRFLELLRDGSDDFEAMRMFRSVCRDYISDTASDRAKEEFDGEVEL